MLNRTAQIGIKVEATEGTEETLTAAEFSGNRKDSGNRLNQAAYDRELERGTLTRQASVKGMRSGGVSYTEEMVGGGAATAAPFHTTLRGLGFGAGVQVKMVVLGTVTNGPFTPGEAIGDNATQGSATKTGTVVCQVDTTPKQLYYIPGTGTFADTDTVYGYAGGSQPSAPVDSAPANAGYTFAPVSEDSGAIDASVTVERRLGGLRYTHVGARATGEVVLRAGEPVQLRAEFTGAPVLDSGAFRTGAVVTGVPAASAAPPVPCKGLVIRFDNAYTPLALTELTISLGGTIANRETICDDDLAGSGYLSFRRGGRDFRARIDPEFVLPATYDYVAKLTSGDAFEILAQVGLPSQTNGMVQIHCPAAQISGDFEPGDREGRVTSPFDIELTGTDDDEIRISHLFG